MRILNTHITRNYTRRTRTEQRKWRHKIEEEHCEMCMYKYVCQKTITSLVLFNSKCVPMTSGPLVLFILKTLVIIVWLWFTCFFSLFLSLYALLSSLRKIVSTRTFQLCAFVELNWIGTKRAQNSRRLKKSSRWTKKCVALAMATDSTKKWLNSLVILRHSTVQRTVMRHSMAYLCG